MKILIIGKEGRFRKNSDPADYAAHEFVYAPINASDDEILAVGADADILIVDAISKASAYLMDHMPNLKMIHSEGVGYQGVDTEAARKRKIYVCNCKGMNAAAVAEQAILLMLGLLRGIVTGDRAFREGKQIERKEAHMLSGDLKELGECTIGFVGFGDIAKETAKAADLFGARILYYRRHRESEATEALYHAAYLPLEELLAQSDIVSLNVPVTQETMNMADASFFARMKEGSYIINTGRGELLDSEALLQALASGHLAGAGLDCVAGEPIEKENAILQAPEEIEDKIIYSCHVGGITGASFRRGHRMVWDNIHRIEAGEIPCRVVNAWES